MIFIVDDDKWVVRAILILLRFAGFDARGFTSAEDFLNDAHVTGSDCIVLDLKMPGMDGFDLMKKFDILGINAKVIILTAYDDVANRQRAREMKAAAFLTKPVDDQALIDTIKWVLQGEDKGNTMRQSA